MKQNTESKSMEKRQENGGSCQLTSVLLMSKENVLVLDLKRMLPTKMFNIPLPSSFLQNINSASRMLSRQQEHAGQGEHKDSQGQRSCSRQPTVHTKRASTRGILRINSLWKSIKNDCVHETAHCVAPWTKNILRTVGPSTVRTLKEKSKYHETREASHSLKSIRS